MIHKTVTRDELELIYHNRDADVGIIAENMDNHFPGWASATATDVEWDAIALARDNNCNHPKWTPWPFDYTKETCAHCGEERRYIKGRGAI